jgi:hypothetical protein
VSFLLDISEAAGPFLHHNLSEYDALIQGLKLVRNVVAFSYTSGNLTEEI